MIPWLSVCCLAFWGVASAQDSQGLVEPESDEQEYDQVHNEQTRHHELLWRGDEGTSTTSKPATTSRLYDDEDIDWQTRDHERLYDDEDIDQQTRDNHQHQTTAKSSTTAQGDNTNGGAKDDFKQVGSDTAGAGKGNGKRV